MPRLFTSRSDRGGTIRYLIDEGIELEISLPDPSGGLGASPYAAPREVEHPLTPLREVGLSHMAWIQPRLMHPAYELWSGERVVATIRFRDLRGREGLAAAADGVWTIHRTQSGGTLFTVHRPRVLIGAFQRVEGNRLVFTLGERRVFEWRPTAIRGDAFAFFDTDRPFMEFRSDRERKGQWLITLVPTTAADPDATLVAIAGKLVTLLHPQARNFTHDGPGPR